MNKITMIEYDKVVRECSALIDNLEKIKTDRINSYMALAEHIENTAISSAKGQLACIKVHFFKQIINEGGDIDEEEFMEVYKTAKKAFEESEISKLKEEKLRKIKDDVYKRSSDVCNRLSEICCLYARNFMDE